MTRQIARSVHWLYWVLTFLPAATLVLFYGYVLHFRVLSGHWPHFNDPDHKTALFAFHRLAVGVSIMTAGASPFLWLVALPLAKRLGSMRAYFLRLSLYLILLLGLILMGQSDPGRFWNWFFD
ncbi:MAG TPA: hypothetical protein VGK40_03180 [Verrucomicrobiae bacterium]